MLNNFSLNLYNKNITVCPFLFNANLFKVLTNYIDLKCQNKAKKSMKNKFIKPLRFVQIVNLNLNCFDLILF